MKFIEPYNPQWKIAFAELRRTLLYVLESLTGAIDIQHVGSTAVPGLYAKPILDIDIIIDNKALLKPASSLLEEAGYIAKGEQGIPGRFAFRQSAANVPYSSSSKNRQPHHLYICYEDCLALKNHLLFRDMLLQNPELVTQYSRLKQSLTDNLQITGNDYMTRKTGFIVSVLTAAGLSEQELAAIIDANT